MNMRESTLEAFLADTRIGERVKLEDYLPVLTGIRPAASLMVPAEFPSGEAIREAIDADYARKFYSGGGRRGLLGFVDRTRLNLQKLLSTPLIFRAGLVRSAFTDVVYEHPEYRAHREWAERLRLDTYQKDLRPSLDDLYIAREEETMDRISRVMSMRDRIREDAQQNRDISAVFLPEEMSPLYLDAVGIILGYPACCVEAYIREAERGLDSGERASEQLEEMGYPESTSAYFALYFYPCRPDCPEAQSLGDRILESVEQLREGLGARVRCHQHENMQYVAAYRETMRKRQEEMLKRMEEARRNAPEG